MGGLWHCFTHTTVDIFRFSFFSMAMVDFLKPRTAQSHVSVTWEFEESDINNWHWINQTSQRHLAKHVPNKDRKTIIKHPQLWHKWYKPLNHGRFSNDCFTKEPNPKGKHKIISQNLQGRLPNPQTTAVVQVSIRFRAEERCSFLREEHHRLDSWTFHDVPPKQLY